MACDTLAGFTLIELMVTIGVAAILSAVAIPAFNSFVLNDRDTAQINSLSMSFNYARSEAVKRNTLAGVKVCPSDNMTTCDTPAAGWTAGWIVLDLDPADPSPVLQGVPALAGANVLSGGANGITFKSTGIVTAPAKIKICDIRGAAYARDVEVNSVGGITASQIPGKDASGASLACP